MSFDVMLVRHKAGVFLERRNTIRSHQQGKPYGDGRPRAYSITSSQLRLLQWTLATRLSSHTLFYSIDLKILLTSIILKQMKNYRQFSLM